MGKGFFILKIPISATHMVRRFIIPPPPKKEGLMGAAQKGVSPMKLNLFVNAAFDEKDGTQTITARLRGNSNAKSFKLAGIDPALALAKNDGIAVEISGKLKVTENYASPEAFKVLDVKRGAYTPKAVEMDADEYFASLSATEEPVDEDEIPF
jgi:hypothetical protein